MAVDPKLLLPGFANAVLDSQSCFRATLRALSRPGTIETIPVSLRGPPPLDLATAAVCLTLFDTDTPVWLDAAANTPVVRTFVRFHSSAPLVDDPSEAAFAVVADPGNCPDLGCFDFGTDQYPDASATLVLQLPSLDGGPPAELTGPGIETRATVSPAGLRVDFASQWALNHGEFPRGVDMFLCSGDRVMGLPRSSRWRQSACT